MSSQGCIKGFLIKLFGCYIHFTNSSVCVFSITLLGDIEVDFDVEWGGFNSNLYKWKNRHYMWIKRSKY